MPINTKIVYHVEPVYRKGTAKQEKKSLESGMEFCPICGSKVIEYDDHCEYGGDSNEGYHYVLMCSNEKCENY